MVADNGVASRTQSLANAGDAEFPGSSVVGLSVRISSASNDDGQLPMRSVIFCGVLCCALLCLWGCNRESQTTVETGSVEKEIEAAHGIAAHKPRTFAQAIDELGIRFRRVQQEQAAGHEVAEVELQQLIDIVRWLPELAADSDLGRSDWELVQQRANELEEQFQSWESHAKPFASEQSTQFLQVVGELTPLAARSTTAWGKSRSGDDLSTTDNPGAVDSPL